MKFRVETNGDLIVMYKDDRIDFIKELGEVSVDRASHVEWSKDLGGWVVKAAHDNELALRKDNEGKIVVTNSGDLAVFLNRKEALKEEVKAFWNLIPEGK